MSSGDGIVLTAFLVAILVSYLQKQWYCRKESSSFGYYPQSEFHNRRRQPRWSSQESVGRAFVNNMWLQLPCCISSQGHLLYACFFLTRILLAASRSHKTPGLSLLHLLLPQSNSNPNSTMVKFNPTDSTTKTIHKKLTLDLKRFKPPNNVAQTRPLQSARRPSVESLSPSS